MSTDFLTSAFNRFGPRKSPIILPRAGFWTFRMVKKLPAAKGGFRFFKADSHSQKNLPAAFLILSVLLLASNTSPLAQERPGRSGQLVQATMGRVRSFQSMAESERTHSQSRSPLFIPSFNTVTDWAP